jgi:hypothetical protein
MAEQIANTMVDALLAYAAVGAAFAFAFVSMGVQKIDPEARGAGIGFRTLIFPGVVALWPLLLRRWAAGVRKPPLERNPHR